MPACETLFATYHAASANQLFADHIPSYIDNEQLSQRPKVVSGDNDMQPHSPDQGYAILKTFTSPVEIAKSIDTSSMVPDSVYLLAMDRGEVIGVYPEAGSALNGITSPGDLLFAEECLTAKVKTGVSVYDTACTDMAALGNSLTPSQVREYRQKYSEIVRMTGKQELVAPANQ